MISKIKELNQKIDALNKALGAEYTKLAEKYGFHLKNKKVVFTSEKKKFHIKFRIPAWKYAIPQNIRHFLSIPFIYAVLLPVVFLDAVISLYQAVAFPLYGIPKVKRRDYIIFDRRFLSYLNWIQKINCLYCSYANGLLAYAVEIAARTERYWCPIKAAQRPKFRHGWYSDFADYGNPEEWKKKFNEEGVFGVCKPDGEKTGE